MTSDQRSDLLLLAKALGCREASLRRDECGDWRINGKRGHVYAVPGTLQRRQTPGFQFFITGWSPAGWTRAKKALAFTDLVNDGDDEGMLFLDRLPTREQAERLRHYVGLAKKATYSDEVMARKREAFLMVRQKRAEKTALAAPDAE